MAGLSLNRMLRWTWASAAVRGTSHVKSEQPLQDAKHCLLVSDAPEEIITLVVSDGAGSASFGGQGAQLTCRSITRDARAHFRGSQSLPSEETLQSWIDNARDWIFRIADARAAVPRDFACTTLLVISSGKFSLICHIGDGCAVFRTQQDSQWIAPLWPDHGEYASTTHFITDDPSPAVRFATISEPIDSIVLFSDGLERLALDFANKKPFGGFFAGVTAPIFTSKARGFDRELSKKLASFLSSDGVNARTDDDKTLIISALR